MEEKREKFIRGLDLTSATSIVVGSMIGSGIFIAPALMAGYIKSPGIIILLWVVGGLFTLLGGLSYGEMAASMPKAGGQYVFLREAYSPLLAFLYGWTLFLVIQTGFIAAVGVAFAKYLGVFVPGISEKAVLFSLSLGPHVFAINTAQVVGIASIIVLTVINSYGIKTGALVQNVLTFLKVGAIVVLIILGFASSQGSISNLKPFLEPVIPPEVKMGLLAVLAVALSKALFAYDAWNSVTFVAEEVKDAQRNLPLSLVLGMVITSILYVLATAVYFYLVPIDQAAAIPDSRIAAVAAQLIFGAPGLYFISAAILISTFGCNNGLIIGGPRVYYAMAEDGLFFKGLSHIHPRYHTPVTGLAWQCAWASMLALSGTYSDLLTYVTFASVIFNVMTVIGLFILRKTRPDLPRPYKAFGYPLVPAAYVLIGAAFTAYIVQGDLANSLKGLGIILLGLPVYFLFKRANMGSSLAGDGATKINGEAE
jgi:APA family basic amino acid/polyamine antiporter